MDRDEWLDGFPPRWICPVCQGNFSVFEHHYHARGFINRILVLYGWLFGLAVFGVICALIIIYGSGG